MDARKLQSLQSAPQVTYSNREAPLEIRSLPRLHNGEDWGYVTFGGSIVLHPQPIQSLLRGRFTSSLLCLHLLPVLSPRHFANPTQALSTINRIQLFRDYLHYHIKCSKAYMHSRMRYRVAEFLKILNRAKPEVATQERKTATGRTFRAR